MMSAQHIKMMRIIGVWMLDMYFEIPIYPRSPTSQQKENRLSKSSNKQLPSHQMKS